MVENQFSLLRTRRFLPLFLVQFLGAFNDNIFKNALVILITYQIVSSSALQTQLAVTFAAGIFILPFFLFSAMAGQLADKFSKSRLIIIIKFCEIIFMLLAALGFYLQNVSLLMTTLFLMGTHSTFFGPIKYAILPDLLRENELIGGNALIEAGTFLAILLGTILGGILVLLHAGTVIVSVMAITVAITGFLFSFFVLSTMPPQPALKINFNIFQETFRIVKQSREEKTVFRSILGISWFWLVGATFLSQIPNFTKDILGANNYVVTLFLVIFSVGVATGSLICNRLLKGEISAKYVPAGILAMTAFIIDMYFASSYVVKNSGEIIGIAEFLTSPNHWRILFDMFFMAVSSGVYIVPLYVIMQTRTAQQHRARTIACNNILNALFMVMSVVGVMLLLSFNLTIAHVFLVLGIANAFAAAYVCKLLPGPFIKPFIRWALKGLYNVQVIGLENYKAAGNRVVIIANHTSFLDVVLLFAFLPDNLTFAVNSFTARVWWIKPLLKFAETFEVDPTNPMAVKMLINAIKQDRRCVIFPEGRITTTGVLMKVYEGPGLVVDKSDAMLLPIRIKGAQYTPFSRLRGKVRIRLFPHISLTILPPRKFEVDPEIKGRQRRQIISAKLYDIMVDMIFMSGHYNKTLFAALIEARTIYKGKHKILEDITRTPLSYDQLITRSYILGRFINKFVRRSEAVGLLLPNTSSVIVAFFAAQAYNRVPAMLNYSAGSHNLILACRMAKIKTVFTAQQFIEKANLAESVAQLSQAGINVIRLEDLRDQITLWHKLSGFFLGRIAQYHYKKNNSDVFSEDPGVILFTSGSEGTPKGVVLSHQNVIANYLQLHAKIDFTQQDTVFNALPLFHAFGLTAGTILPLIAGVRVFLYPSPLHYRMVPEMVYETNATITFGTDTFLSGYGRYAHPYDFYSARYVFAGAEKLREETRKLWMEKFGIRILEGYGATETAPAISVNTAMQNKSGTVGTLLPGIQFRIEPMEGIKEGGRLWLAGPNVMLGYLNIDQPGAIISPPDGWYDTGDIVVVDAQGYLTIKDRVKRFAKIGGEMVSLTAIENFIHELWSNKSHAIMTAPDVKKGEQLILITENKKATREEIITFYKQKGISELQLPRRILFIDKMPLLGTGKVDYMAVKEWLKVQL